MYGKIIVIISLLFLALKLSNIITLSWWWVLSPVWLPSVILLGFSFTVTILILSLVLAAAQFAAANDMLKSIISKFGS